MLRKVVLDLFDQGEACGERSGGGGGGGLRQEAARHPEVVGGAIQRGERQVGATQRRAGKHVLVKVEGRPAGCGLCARRSDQAVHTEDNLKVPRRSGSGAIRVASPALLVLGSGESRPSSGGGPSSLPFGDG